MSKLWRSWSVGGDPDRMAFLACELSTQIRRLQDNQWEILSVDKINIDKAWSSDRRTYMPCVEYIIVGYYEKK